MYLGASILLLGVFLLIGNHWDSLGGATRVWVTAGSACAAYVMAVRMGGDGRLVGLIISAGTPIAAITIPLWLLLAS
jgi:predicted permease